MPGKFRKIVAATVVVAAVAFGSYYVLAGRSAAQSSRLTGSGTVEVTDITLSTAVSGRVKTIDVQEGDTVRAGQRVVQLDDALLQAQRTQAVASLSAALGAQDAAQANQASAQAQLDQLRAGPRAQEVSAEQQAVAAAQGRAATAVGQLAQARGALQAATAQREQAVAGYSQVKQGARPEQIDAAAVAYQQSEAAVQQAQAAYDKIRGDPDIAMRPQALALQQATLAAESTRANYQGILAGATTPQLAQARAAIDQAVAGIIQATATISQTEAAVTTANANLAAERARLDLLQAGASPSQIKAGEASLAAAQAQARAAAGQVDAAKAALAAVDVQIAQLSLSAPADGVVLTRSIEPGELALPGSPLLVLGDLGRPTLTVYLPEDQYGVLHVGDRAQITADSFPGRAFSGVVRHIADQAEFTPRNVQTPAGRRTTVFAVRLDINNPDLALKPGMPADAIFESGTGAAAAARR